MIRCTHTSGRVEFRVTWSPGSGRGYTTHDDDVIAMLTAVYGAAGWKFERATSAELWSWRKGQRSKR